MWVIYTSVSMMETMPEEAPVENKRYSLVRPTIQTPFRIDFAWWQQNDRDWHVYLSALLCEQHQEIFSQANAPRLVDRVDPQTAEVQRVDGIQHALISHCARQEGFITQHTALVDAIFRLFLANDNTPMTPVEMGGALNRPAETILKMLTGGRVYKGVRPYQEN